MGYIEDYLDQLRTELKGCDPALLQDALFDAEDHLRAALATAQAETAELSELEAFHKVVERYGSPVETASAYREIETRISPFWPPESRLSSRSPAGRFFGIFGEPRAWGAFLYMLFAGLTGGVYGLWALIGGAGALLCSIFIFGIPVAGLFLFSIRGIALLEGRLAQALLGVRMPWRPIFIQREIGWGTKIKLLFTEVQTWKALIYTLLQLPLGLAYSLFIALALALSLSFMAAPLLELVFKLPLELFGTDTFTPVWLLPVVSLGGIFMLPMILHTARRIGKLHGRYAKTMLVKR